MNNISILKKISTVIDLLNKKQYTFAINELRSLINEDFFSLCNGLLKNRKDIEEILLYLNNIIKYYNDKRLNLSNNSEIVLYSLEKLKFIICGLLTLDDFNYIDESLSFTDINDIIHERIFKFFVEHFEAVCSLNLERVYNSWKKLCFYLDKHAYVEDTVLEPVYISFTTKFGVPKGGEYNQFIYEHKILKKISNDVEKLICNIEKNYEYIVSNLDSYFYFKNFWVHHSLRERNIFYKFLEEKLEHNFKQELKRELVKSIREWEF
ncbi:MAG: hypothetical protein N2169_02895 [bacterium]|nr:hypothetical protein [bacterium]